LSDAKIGFSAFYFLTTTVFSCQDLYRHRDQLHIYKISISAMFAFSFTMSVCLEELDYGIINVRV